MNSFIVRFLTLLISTFLFSMLFNALNKSKLNLFAPLQVLANKTKKKKLLSFVILLIFLYINEFIKTHYKLNEIIYVILFAFFLALHGIIFNKDIAYNNNI